MGTRTDYQRDYYVKNRERIKTRVAALHAARKIDPAYLAKRSEYQNRYYETKGRDKRREQVYRLKPGQYEQQLAIQLDSCAICRTKTPGGKGTFHIDHDHKTGKFRGLLCSACNLMLGHAHDNPETLRSATSYLQGE